MTDRVSLSAIPNSSTRGRGCIRPGAGARPRPRPSLGRAVVDDQQFERQGAGGGVPADASRDCPILAASLNAGITIVATGAVFRMCQC